MFLKAADTIYEYKNIVCGIGNCAPLFNLKFTRRSKLWYDNIYDIILQDVKGRLCA